MRNVNQPTVSVALCTHNGQAFLPVQWESLRQQTWLPDELIICDDRSTDGTLALLETLAADAPFRVRIEQNSTQLGYNRNFEQVLSLCSGDLIFLCDQDDAWLPEKISTMVDFMVDNPSVQIAFCNARIADEQLNTLPGFFWERVQFDEAAQTRWLSGEAMDVLLEGNRMMGCASVIRRTFLPLALPFPSVIPGYIYDGWLALLAAGINAVQFIEKPLQLYRTHASQQVGIRPPTELSARIRLRDRLTRQRSLKLDPLHQKADKLHHLLTLLAPRLPANAPGIYQLQRRWQHYQMRSTLPLNQFSRIRPVLNGLFSGSYHRYAEASADWTAPFIAALGDLVE